MLTLLLIGVLAGAVTAVSPCVLPVLPVVFFGAGTLTATGVGSPVQRSAGGGTLGTVGVVRRGGAVRIVAGLVLSFAVLTLTGSLVVTALHLPAWVLRWAGSQLARFPPRSESGQRRYGLWLLCGERLTSDPR